MEKKVVLQKTVEFIQEHKESIEICYQNASGTRRPTYIKEITIDEYTKKLAEVSVVILTANEFEENILNYYSYVQNTGSTVAPVLQVNEKIYINNSDIGFYAYILQFNDYTVLHMHSENTGSYTNGGSADLVRYIADSKHIFPSCIVSFGICFGHDINKQKLGETIIAKSLYPYFIGVKLTDGELTVNSDKHVLHLEKSDKALYDKLEYLKRNGLLEHKSALGKNTHIEQKVVIGNMITGEAVVSDSIYKRIFENGSNIRNPLGGEMEGYGLGKECLFYKIPCMLIKAICDWGESKNIDAEIENAINISNAKDRIQAYTAYCAFLVLQQLFDLEFFDKSLFYKCREKLVSDYKTTSQSFIPFNDIEKTIMNVKWKYGCKKVTSEYIHNFCDNLIDKGFWEKKRHGYSIKVEV